MWWGSGTETVSVTQESGCCRGNLCNCHPKRFPISQLGDGPVSCMIPGHGAWAVLDLNPSFTRPVAFPTARLCQSPFPIVTQFQQRGVLVPSANSHSWCQLPVPIPGPVSGPWGRAGAGAGLGALRVSFPLPCAGAPRPRATLGLAGNSRLHPRFQNTLEGCTEPPALRLKS